MKHIDFSKYSFYFISILLLLGLSFSFGLYTAVYETNVFKIVKSFKVSLRQIRKDFSTFTHIHPSHFLQPAKYKGNGVTVNDVTANKDELIFMSGFFDGGNELRLIRRDGTIIAKWPVSFSKIFPDTSHLTNPPTTDWNIDIHGALALPDGSVVFNFEYAGLVKLDQFGNVVWVVARETHHSVVLAEDGGFWVAGSRHHPKGSDSPFPPFEPPFRENMIFKVSQNGKILSEISVPGIFYDNNLEALLTSNGKRFTLDRFSRIDEIVHLNKIQELSSDIASNFPMFEAGDLALSLRKYNLIMVMSPKTGKIKWWKIGPWIRQHDPEFTPDGKIIVFNNNTYRTAFGKQPNYQKSLITIPRVSNIIEFDPTNDTYKVIYGGNNEQRMLSVIRGKVEVTQNGGLLITEFEGGRVFETDNKGRIIWEYINRYDSDEVAEITEAKIYQSDYFGEIKW